MATAKSTSTTRRSGSTSKPKKDSDAEVSPARWAGVALVITAIVAAIFLAVISPSEPSQAPGTAAIEPSPSPRPTVLDGQAPMAQPRIISPITETTNEIDFPAKVELPEEELPKRLLTLYILRGDQIVGELPRPKTGGTVTVPSVRVDEGVNELTAVLSGPGGYGPRSEPVILTVDRDAPDLAITAPKNKIEIYDETIVVEGTSEVGSKVLIRNETNGHKATETVGNSGIFDATIRLKRGVVNRIVATSEDKAKIPRSATVRVTRLDGRPRIKIKDIDPIKRSSLPAKVRIVVDVTDAKGKPLSDAQVDYSLGGADRTTQTEADFTNAEGRSVWAPVVEPSSSTTDSLELSVTVTSPLSGQTRETQRTIDFR